MLSEKTDDSDERFDDLSLNNVVENINDGNITNQIRSTNFKIK